MEEININPFNLHAMKGILALLGNKCMEQIKPCSDNGIEYSLATLENHLVICPEWKGGKQPSVVVCDTEGNFLLPLQLDKLVNNSFSFPYPYANVFGGKKLITVETHWNLEENCSINLHQIINTHDSIYMVETKTIWGGFYVDIPKEFLCFGDVIDLAEERKKGL